MSTFARRFGFGKKQHDAVLHDTVSPVESGSSADVQILEAKDAEGLNLGVDQSTVITASGTDRRISEVEANTTLKQIRSKHKWDPNLPENLEEEIDEKTEEHNLAGELRLVDELVENSPYVEVRAAVKNVRMPCPIRRCCTEHSTSMMWTFLSIPFAPGFSVCFSPPLRLG